MFDNRRSLIENCKKACLISKLTYNTIQTKCKHANLKWMLQLKELELHCDSKHLLNKSIKVHQITFLNKKEFKVSCIERWSKLPSRVVFCNRKKMLFVYQIIPHYHIRMTSYHIVVKSVHWNKFEIEIFLWNMNTRWFNAYREYSEYSILFIQTAHVWLLIITFLRIMF